MAKPGLHSRQQERSDWETVQNGFKGTAAVVVDGDDDGQYNNSGKNDETLEPAGRSPIQSDMGREQAI